MDVSTLARARAAQKLREARLAADWRVPLLVLLVLAAALRLYQLGAESLWVDEGFSLRDATRPFTIAKASKPVYFWFLAWWMQLGDADWLLRLPAAIFGAASVAMVFLLGRTIWGTRAGTFAALLAAVSPLHVNHSQEVRMYTLLVLEASAAVYFLVLAIRTWRFRYMLACAVCTCLATLTHPTASLLLLPANVAVLDAYLRKRRPLGWWFAAQAAILVAWIPWLPYVLGFGDTYGDQAFLALMRKPTAAEIPMLWGKFGIGEWGAGSTVFHVGLYAYTYGAAILVALAVWLDRRRPEARLAAAWLVMPVVALLLVSTLKANAWVPRFLIFISPAFFLLLGAVWSRLQSRIILLLLGAFLLIPPAGKLAWYYVKTNRPELRQAAQYVSARQRPADVIAVYRESNEFIFDHYYDGEAGWVVLKARDFLEDRKSEFTDWDEEKALKMIRAAPRAPRQWLVLSKLPPRSEMPIDSALRTHYRVLEARKFNEVTVYLFQHKGGRPWKSTDAEQARGYGLRLLG